MEGKHTAYWYYSNKELDEKVRLLITNYIDRQHAMFKGHITFEQVEEYNPESRPHRFFNEPDITT